MGLITLLVPIGNDTCPIDVESAFVHVYHKLEAYCQAQFNFRPAEIK